MANTTHATLPAYIPPTVPRFSIPNIPVYNHKRESNDPVPISPPTKHAYGTKHTTPFQANIQEQARIC